MTHRSILLRFVLLVSFAHAMTHLLEQSVGSIEKVVSTEFELNTRQSGALGSAFRIPYGLGAILAGILADRMGAQRVLVLFLTGGGLTCLSFAATPSANMLYVQVFVLGCFASMYHPAGLALLANRLEPSERPRALGLHGVFGSTGIASAPFLAGLTLSIPGTSWRSYYVVLGVMCGLLAFLVATRLKKSPPDPSSTDAADKTQSPAEAVPGQAIEPIKPAQVFVDKLQVLPYFALVLSSATSGIVYGGFLHFLMRYLSEVSLVQTLAPTMGTRPESLASYYTAAVLMFGAASQWLTGRIASPRHLPQQLALVYAANAPFLWWMSFAEGTDRLIAASLLAFVHFMNQPLYNSLLPEFIPPHRRSTWFGFSNMMGFGFGAIGPYLVGLFADYREAYAALAGVALFSAIFPLMVWFRRSTNNSSENASPGFPR